MNLHAFVFIDSGLGDICDEVNATRPRLLSDQNLQVNGLTLVWIEVLQSGKPTTISPQVTWLTNCRSQHTSALKSPEMICHGSWILKQSHTGGALELLLDTSNKTSHFKCR